MNANAMRIKHMLSFKLNLYSITFQLLLVILFSFASITNTYSQIAINPSSNVRRDELNVLESAIWETNIINVCWENPNQNNQNEREIVRASIENTWEKESLVDFIAWGVCSNDSKGIRIFINDEGPHTKELGKNINGVKNGMVLNFTFNNWGCEDSQGNQIPCVFPYDSYDRDDFIRIIAVHEFGHALSFAHEQNRPDTPSWCNERQGSDGTMPIGDWDLDSVMNYCNPQWSGDGNLSPTDIAGVQMIYGAEPWTTAENDFKEYYVGDYNGDVNDDILRINHEWGGADVLISTGSKFKEPVHWSGAGYYKNHGGRWYVGDYDDDGKDDILRINHEWGGADVLISTGSKFKEPVHWSGAGYYKNHGGRWYVGDYNGDKKADIARYHPEKGMEVLLSDGSKFGNVERWSIAGPLQGFIYIGDYNGNRKSDFLVPQTIGTSQNWVGALVYLSEGSKFLLK